MPPKKAKEGRPEKPGLSRESIVRAALKIVDSEGYRALSMRRLGAELNVDPMAVYYHIPNKSSLLDGVVEAVMGEIDLGLDDASRPAAERLAVALGAYREVLLAHPLAIQIVAFRPPRTPAALRPAEVLLRILRGAGFSPTDAMAAMHILAIFVRGYVFWEAPHLYRTATEGEEAEAPPKAANAEELLDSLPPEEFPVFLQTAREARPVGFEAGFERGIKALIQGLLATFIDNDRTE